MTRDPLEEIDDYREPASLMPAAGASARRPSRGALSTHVPIRFRADTVAAVRAFAEADGTTVSTWIRNLVQREVTRRHPPITGAGSKASIEITRASWAPVSASRGVPLPR